MTNVLLLTTHVVLVVSSESPRAQAQAIDHNCPGLQTVIETLPLGIIYPSNQHTPTLKHN